MMGYNGACNGFLWYMGHTSKWQFRVQCHVFWRLLVTIENDVLSTKLIIIFIIELGIWAVSYTHLTLPTNREV